MIRKANISEIPVIRGLISRYADERKLLPRALSELYENIRDFYVHLEEDEVVGCAALHVVWEDLAEIKSLAVREGCHGKGYGRGLVEACTDEARELGIQRLFALTYMPSFFEQFGFRQISKEELPHKIWSECVRCPFFPDCGEVAVILELSESRTSLSDLA